MSSTATTRLIPVTIEGPAGALEALLQEYDGVTPSITALVCHPHPLHGGTLHNKVAHRIASTLHSLGAAVLRFNFRGAGKSAGVHDEGVASSRTRGRRSRSCARDVPVGVDGSRGSRLDRGWRPGSRPRSRMRNA